MNRPKHCFLIVFAIWMLNCAESMATSGYYIKTSGDTVWGNFLNVPEIGNPSLVDFIPGGMTEVRTLKPGEIRSFHVGPYDSYLSYTGTRMLNATDGSASAGTASDTISTFLREIGEAHGYSFYSYSDSKRVNLFYSDDESSASELRYISATPMTGDFRDQLNVMLSSKVDTAVLNPMIKKLEYSEEGMINFIDELNEGKIAYPPVNGFVATVGYSYNMFSATGSNQIPAVATNYSEEGSWLIGFGYIKSLKKEGGNYFIYPNIKAFSYKTTGTIKRHDGEITTKFSSDLVLFPAFNVGYHLINKSTIKLFLSPGFGFMFFMNNKEESSYAYYNGAVDSYVKEKTHVTFDVNLKTGIIVLQHYMLWFAYNIPTPVSGDTEFRETPYTGNLSGFQGGVGVKF